MPKVTLHYDFTNLVSLGGDYDYIVELTPEDIADDLICSFVGEKEYNNWTQEKKMGFLLAIEIMWKNDIIATQKNDEYEVCNQTLDYLYERFKDEAQKQCLEDFREYRYTNYEDYL